MEKFAGYFLDFIETSLNTLGSLTSWLWSPWDVLEQIGLGQIAPIAILTFGGFLAVLGFHVYKLIKIW